MFKPDFMMARAFLKVSILLAIGLGLMGCTMFGGQQGTSQTQAASKRPQVLAVFEQKIVQQLLLTAPDLKPIYTEQEAIEAVESLDKIVNQSGINLGLLDSATKTEFLNRQSQLHRIQYQLANWPALNHMADVQKLPASSEVQVNVAAIDMNLNSPAKNKRHYPEILVTAAIKLLDDKTSAFLNLAELQFRSSSDAQQWAKQKLDPLLTIEQQRYALEQLKSLSKIEPLEIDEKLTKNQTPASELYRDPYYSVTTERNPEQIVLDLIALHLEEALSSARYGKAISIQGSEEPLFSVFINDETGLTINLGQLKLFPAFEYQAIAYQAAGELLVNEAWASEWRQSIGIAVGLKLSESLLNNMTTKHIAANPSLQLSLLGSKTRRQLQFFLAISELKLALGHTSLDSIKAEMSESFPYSPSQVDAVLLSWFAERGSIAAGLLFYSRFTTLPLEQWIDTIRASQPSDYSDLENRANSELVQ